MLERAFLNKKKLFDDVLEQTEDFSEKKLDAISQRWLNAIEILHGEFHRLVKDAVNCIEDLNIYIESLEKYSSELDKTLWDIIKQAEKTAEEEIKKKQELLKKTPQTYRI